MLKMLHRSVPFVAHASSALRKPLGKQQQGFPQRQAQPEAKQPQSQGICSSHQPSMAPFCQTQSGVFPWWLQSCRSENRNSVLRWSTPKTQTNAVPFWTLPKQRPIEASWNAQLLPNPAVTSMIKPVITGALLNSTHPHFGRAHANMRSMTSNSLSPYESYVKVFEWSANPGDKKVYSCRAACVVLWTVMHGLEGKLVLPVSLCHCFITCQAPEWVAMILVTLVTVTSESLFIQNHVISYREGH